MEMTLSRSGDIVDEIAPAATLAAARKEHGELDGLKPSSIVVRPASVEHYCSQCSALFGEGREVLWIRTNDDEVITVMPGVTIERTWKSTPWHRSCWDLFEAAIDARRVELEKILGEEHHELDS
jgi:hypothetical protein